jgi:hypothetical protein
MFSMKHRSLHLLGLILFVFPLLVFPQRHTLAATFTASTPLELAGAITAANNAPGADTILLTNSIYLEEVYEQNGTPTAEDDAAMPLIESLITIDGQGYTIERASSAPNFRFFLVASGGLTLSNLTLTNGNVDTYSGGSIYNLATLNLINTTISYSRAATGGAIISDGGTLNITNSTLSNNITTGGGGAVTSFSNTTITNSIFDLNSGSGGGAVFLGGGTHTITTSTFIDNFSGDNGGAILVGQFTTLNISSSTIYRNTTGGIGGGIYNVGTLNLTNSTFTDNLASTTGGGVGSGVDTFGDATIKNSTFIHNITSLAGTGGGVAIVGGSGSVSNSVFRGNSPVNEACTNASGSNNLVDSLALPTTCTGFTLSPAAGINIGNLTSNGGSTATNPINANPSSAIDTADAATCAAAPVSGVDQRGVPRGLDGNGTPNNPQAGDCDIGAYEFGGTIRTLQFATASSSVTSGSVNNMSVALSLDAPLPAGYAPVTAYVRVSGGTALAGVNYDPFSVQTVTFNPGDQTKNVTITLLNGLINADKTILFSFATSSGAGFSGPANFGTQITHTLTLKVSPSTASPVPYYYGTRDITLTWDNVSWATGYELQVDTDAGFGAPRVYENANLSVDTLSQLVTVPGNNTYYWRVLAKKADGTPGNYTPTQSFIVAGT